MDPVAEAYSRSPEGEWNRLVRDPYHHLEFLVTIHHVRQHLPAGCVVLDIGGGPGRYAIELCRLGYRVALLDLAPGNIAWAEARMAEEPSDVRERLFECSVGDVRDLSRFGIDQFDGVLCLDPLTYVTDADARLSAVRELARVARSGAVVFIGVRSLYAVLRTTLRLEPQALAGDRAETLIRTGDSPIFGLMCHFFRGKEIRQLAELCGLHTLALVGCEGLSGGMPEATNTLSLDSRQWRRWVQLVTETCSDPAVVEMAEHMLYIGTVLK